MQFPNNITFFIKLERRQPIKVETHWIDDDKRVRPLRIVAHLISAFLKRSSVYGNVSYDKLRLKLPNGYDRSSLPSDCFANEDNDDTTLAVDCPLAVLLNVSISWDTDEDSEIRRYINIGKLLLKEKEYFDLKKSINQIRTMDLRLNANIRPFIFLYGSSGVGKTQSAFTLVADMEPILYVPVLELQTMNGAVNQRIYQSFETRTIAIHKCVGKDLKVLQSPSLSTYYDLASDELPLWTYGFLLAWITNSSVIRKTTCQEVVNVSPKLKPIVFTDEFSVISNEAFCKHFRNCCHAVGWVFIASSTHYSVINMFSTHSGPRGSEDPVHWVTLISKFPSYNEEAASEDAVLHSLWSRPWFTGLAKKLKVNAPLTADSLDVLLSRINEYVFRAKVSPRIVKDFNHGQLCLFFGSHYIQRLKGTCANILMNGHFPVLNETSPLVLYLGSNGEILKRLIQAGGSDSWVTFEVGVAFPDISLDPLLYLTLMGGPECKTFTRISYDVSSKGRIVEARFIEALGQHLLQPNQMLNFQNPSVNTQNGLTLEASVSAAIVLASHRGGIEGIGLELFFNELLKALGIDTGFEFAFGSGTLDVSEDDEFDQEEEGPDSVLESGIDIDKVDDEPEEAKEIEAPIEAFLSKFKEMIVPWLFPPNIQTSFNLENARFGLFSRTLNISRTDGKFNVLKPMIKSEGLAKRKGSSEMKQRRVNSECMKNILDRVPVDSILHLVFCKEMQRSYFKSGNLNGYQNEKLANCAIYKVQDGKLHQISGIPQPSGVQLKRLVLFFELDLCKLMNKSSDSERETKRLKCT